MLPGFLTDVIGFLFLLRWTRPIARKLIAFFVARRINRLGIPVMRARLDRENLIEGETVQSPSRREPEGLDHHRGGDRGAVTSGSTLRSLAPSAALGRSKGAALSFSAPLIGGQQHLTRRRPKASFCSCSRAPALATGEPQNV